MTDLIDTTEMYLRIILELEEEGQVPKRARIVERLDQSGPTVSETVARMQKNGLLEIGDNRQIELSTSGRKQAVSVLRKHRIAELFLHRILGIEWELLHQEACKWEHVISDLVEQKMLAQLGEVKESPFGNPIPGAGAGSGAISRVIALSDLPTAIAVQNTLQLRRIGENLQSDVELLRNFAAVGFVPGAEFKVSVSGNSVVVTVGKSRQTLEILGFQAEQLFIAE